MATSGLYHLRTLGELRLTGTGGELLAGRRKELVLLTYLAMKSPRPVAREELAALLWGEREEAKARQSLRHALYQLRQAMGDAVLVNAESASVPPHMVALDAAVLERDHAAGRFAEAAEQWQGDFLRGLEDAGDESYRDWLEGQREALRRVAGAAFARAAQVARDSSDLDAELTWAARWTEAFPLDSLAHGQLVEARLRNGDFAEARRAFDAHQSRLRHELGEDPPIEFLRLGEELDRLERRSAERHPGSAALLMPDLVGRDAILASLLQLWGRVSTASAVVVIEGDDGIGKSRLAAELARRVRASSPGARVVETTGPACDGESLFPALLVVDDAAGADEASRERLLALAQELPRSSMLVLARRPEEWPDLTRALDLGRIPTAVRIKLTPLSERDVTALLDSMLEITPADRDALAARLATESGGNPFYLLELVYALADAGVLVLLPTGRWQLDPALTSRALPVPANIRAAIRIRLSQLSEPARALVDAAVTSGVPVTLEAASAASGLSGGGFESALDELLAHRILRPVADGRGGYEFTHSLIGRVAAERAIATTTASPESRGATAGRPSVARWTWVLAVLLVLIGVAIGWARWRAGATPAADGPARVAVLDLALVAPDSSEAWLAAGLSEEISAGLSRFEGIRIKSRGALRAHPVPRTTDPIALGRELQVDYLVEGTLLRAGDRLRVGVRLTSTTDGFQVWGRDFDTPAAELPELHDRIAALVAARIGGRLAPGDSAAVRRPITTSAQAFEHFLRGTWLLARRTPLTVEQAIDQFRLALALDPTFSAAAARIAYGLTIVTEWGWSYRGADPGQVVREGITMVDRALEADSSSSDAWLARAHLLVIQDPVSMKGAIDAFERAIALDPRSVEAQYQIGQALMAQGRWEEARIAYRKAIELEPERAQTFVSLGSIERKLGFTELATRLYDSALIVEPGASYARSARAVLRLATGDVPGALDDAETAVRTTQGYSVPPRSVLAASLALSGDSVGARRELATARSAMRNPEHPNPTDARWLGAALIAGDQTDEVLDLLERARPRGAWLWFYFTASEFDPIRNHPRFVRVMRDARP